MEETTKRMQNENILVSISVGDVESSRSTNDLVSNPMHTHLTVISEDATSVSTKIG